MVSDPVGVAVCGGVTLDVPVADAVALAVDDGVLVEVAVGGVVVSRTSSAVKSGLLLRPSWFTSEAAHTLPLKMAVTTAPRSRWSTTPSQFASPPSAWARETLVTLRSTASSGPDQDHRRPVRHLSPVIRTSFRATS